MQIIINPAPEIWADILKRPVYDQKKMFTRVKKIMDSVKVNGDRALYDFTQKFDGVSVDSLLVEPDLIEQSVSNISPELKEAIWVAKNNIEIFHKQQIQPSQEIETFPGVVCWRKNVPIESVGLYIPGGSAPLFTTLLMLGVPARLAGCPQIIICTPPDKKGQVNDSILFCAKILGITTIYRVGGAQAIAALTFGTESLPKVFKIFGPGNQYVTIAKQLASLENVAIDLPAGPSEVAVIADKSANAEFVASDLLSQAEHGADSQVILITDSESLLEQIHRAIMRQLKLLPRKNIAQKSLESAKLICVQSLQVATELVNIYAPEHLIIATRNARKLSEKIFSAGSVFIGHFSSESAGDYASGTNHTLPTNGYAHNYSGVSIDSFLKKITFQELSIAGVKNLGPYIEIMAEAESLHAHARSIQIRREYIEQEHLK
jgi:histidinol dehydrogenase